MDIKGEKYIYIMKEKRNMKVKKKKENYGDLIKKPPTFIFHCHNDIGKWYCEMCPNYNSCNIKNGLL